uniref:B30.2/SPRY domain-containing protein n=1 Tax=Dicentrarchus labrax TaxID=13489 RepID=A0A8P4PWS4_DICLA
MDHLRKKKEKRRWRWCVINIKKSLNCSVRMKIELYSISAVKEELPFVPFQCSLSDPQLVSGALIDVAKHLGNLSFGVWEKMKDKVHFSPVILDPNTAHPRLYLSGDLTSVRYRDTKQQLPNNPERNTNYRTVLGSEGFSSGKHSWEVESVDRKGERYAAPKSGIWCLLHDDGEYSDGPGKTVTVKKRLQKIRVQLDYDRGEVSFYDPEHMTHIFTHRDNFTEKLFPYFCVGAAALFINVLIFCSSSPSAELIGVKSCLLTVFTV